MAFQKLYWTRCLIFAMYSFLQFGIASCVPKCIMLHGDAHFKNTWWMYAHPPHMSHNQGSTARISVFTVLLTSGDELEIGPDRIVQHHPPQASEVPVFVGSWQYLPSLSSSHPLASSLLLPRPSRPSLVSCQPPQTQNPWLYTTQLMSLPLESMNTSTVIHCLGHCRRIQPGLSHGPICAIRSLNASIAWRRPHWSVPAGSRSHRWSFLRRARVLYQFHILAPIFADMWALFTEACLRRCWTRDLQDVVSQRCRTRLGWPLIWISIIVIRHLQVHMWY